MAKVTGRGGKAWSGNAEQCAACGLVFGSTLAGDAHRVGEHGVKEGPDRRRCLTVEEMQAKVVQAGARKGEPWFATRINRYGTEVWVRSQQERTWFPAQDVTKGLEGSAGVMGPDEGLQAPHETHSTAEVALGA